MFPVTAFNIIEFYVCLRRLSFYNFCSNDLIERNLGPILQEKPLHTINLNLYLLALEKKCYCHMKGNALFSLDRHPHKSSNQMERTFNVWIK